MLENLLNEIKEGRYPEPEVAQELAQRIDEMGKTSLNTPLNTQEYVQANALLALILAKTLTQEYHSAEEHRVDSKEQQAGFRQLLSSPTIARYEAARRIVNSHLPQYLSKEAQWMLEQLQNRPVDVLKADAALRLAISKWAGVFDSLIGSRRPDKRFLLKQSTEALAYAFEALTTPIQNPSEQQEYQRASKQFMGVIAATLRSYCSNTQVVQAYTTIEQKILGAMTFQEQAIGSEGKALQQLKKVMMLDKDIVPNDESTNTQELLRSWEDGIKRLKEARSDFVQSKVASEKILSTVREIRHSLSGQRYGMRKLGQKVRTGLSVDLLKKKQDSINSYLASTHYLEGMMRYKQMLTEPDEQAKVAYAAQAIHNFREANHAFNSFKRSFEANNEGSLRERRLDDILSNLMHTEFMLAKRLHDKANEGLISIRDGRLDANNARGYLYNLYGAMRGYERTLGLSEELQARNKGVKGADVIKVCLGNIQGIVRAGELWARAINMPELEKLFAAQPFAQRSGQPAGQPMNYQ